jgi:predicted nucleic-acid-binding protein
MAHKLIDANVILRYLLKDDEVLFKRAFEILERVKTGDETVVILESVMAEVVYVLLKIYKVEKERIAEKMVELLTYKGIGNPDKNDLIEALRLFEKTKLSFVDCILCARAGNHGLGLFTFDDRLRKVAKQSL